MIPRDADGRKCISDGSPSAAWFWNHWFKIMYSHQMLYTQFSNVVVLEKSNADNLLTLYVQCFVHVRGYTGVSMIKETKLSRKMMTMMTTRCDSLLFILVMTRTLNIYESILWIFTSTAKEVMFLVALVSLSVCLSVCGQHYSKVMNGLGWNFMERSWVGRTDQILVVIWVL